MPEHRDYSQLGGWLDLAEAKEWYTQTVPNPYFQAYSSLAGSGEGVQVCLWKAYEKVTKATFVPHFQELGDCVSHGFTLGAEVLACFEIMSGQREEWRGKFSTEVTYAGSRVEIGKGRIKNGDGSMGAWAAEFLRLYGVVLRGVYGNIDLTEYRPDLAKSWGYWKNGVPDNLEPIAREHPIKTTARVESWEQYCDAIANGYPVAICSNVGFKNGRADSDGFLTPRGTWMHCMLGWGVDTVSRRQGGNIVNSHGSRWTSGPQHKLGTPSGSFWTDAKVIDGMLRQGDSYALSGFNGFPSQSPNYFLI